jgi:hypothetical protein
LSLGKENATVTNIHIGLFWGCLSSGEIERKKCREREDQKCVNPQDEML